MTPSFAQRTYSATLADHYGLFGGTLDSSLSYQRFHTFIGAQGDLPETVTPEGNSGNFFGTQSRDAFRREWLEIWSPAPLKLLGTHQIKAGSSLTIANDRGAFDYRPVNIYDSTGLLLENITFSNAGQYKRTDLEYTLYGQDHWSPGRSCRSIMGCGWSTSGLPRAFALRRAPGSPTRRLPTVRP